MFAQHLPAHLPTHHAPHSTRLRVFNPLRTRAGGFFLYCWMMLRIWVLCAAFWCAGSSGVHTPGTVGARELSLAIFNFAVTGAPGDGTFHRLKVRPGQHRRGEVLAYRHVLIPVGWACCTVQAVGFAVSASKVLWPSFQSSAVRQCREYPHAVHSSCCHAVPGFAVRLLAL